MENEINITCKNDVLFKYLLVNDIRLVKIILYGVTHYHQLDLPAYEMSEIKLKNPNLLPTKLDGKSVIFNLAIEDENRILYDIEMQNTSFYTDLYQRFHYYGSFMIVSQLHQGDDYSYIRPCHQIIFIDDISKSNVLIDTFEPKDQLGFSEYKTHLYTHYVYMPYINIIAKKKGLEKLNLFEKIIYAIENNLSDDIIKLEEEVINCMNINKINFFSDDENSHWIIARRAAKLTEDYLRYSLKENKNALKNAVSNLMQQSNYSYEEAIKILGINKDLLK